LRQVQGHSPPRRGARDLPEPEAQAETGIVKWLALLEWIFRARSGSKSA
jgi:hypothetical protein